MAENHPRVRAYVKNHNLGFDVPYRHGSESHVYRPDFIVLVEDGHGEDDLLHLVVEVKGYRREDAKDKKLTMESYWIPGVNNSKNSAAGPLPSLLRCLAWRPISPRASRASFGRSSIP